MTSTFNLITIGVPVAIVSVAFAFFGRLNDIRDALNRIATALESIDQKTDISKG
jgi:hypothetical protein